MGFQIGFPALRNYPPLPGGGGGYDADAQAMFDARAAVSDEPTAAYKQAISDYVTAIKAVSGLWDDIIQLVVLAGATTVDGASKSIKGNDLTSYNFIDTDIDPKLGSTGNGVLTSAGKAWSTGYTGVPSPAGQDDIHSYMYITGLGANPNALFGAGAGNTGTWRFREELSNGMRSNLDSHTSITDPGGYGMNRANSADYEKLLNGVTSTAIRDSQTPQNATYYLLANSTNNSTARRDDSHSTASMLIWAIGSSITTLADYNTPADDLITALNAI